MTKRRTKRRTTRKRRTTKQNMPNWLLWLMRVGIMFLILGGICWYVLLAYVDNQITSNPNSRHLLFYSQDISNNSHLMVVHLAPNAAQASAYIIDSEETIEVAGGYGEYPLRAIPGLIALDYSTEEERTTLVSLTLGQVIDSIYQVDQDIQPPLEEVGLKRIINRINNEAWDGWQKFKMSRMLSIVPESRFIYNPELVELDTYLKASASDYPLSVCAVAVVNATDSVGLAKRYTDLMEESGLTVYRTTSDLDKAEHTQVLVDEAAIEDCALTLERIKPATLGVKPTQKSGISQEYRADVVVLLGEDTARMAE